MKIMVVGAGYVGLVAAACLSKSGHDVICIEKNTDKLKQIENGKVTICEEGLENILFQSMKNRKLYFASKLYSANDLDVIMVTVGTPSLVDGRADLSQIYDLLETIIERVEQPLVVVMKSTVPPGVGMILKERYLSRARVPISYISNPEFLREGQAIWDWYNPDRIVIGGEDRDSINTVVQLYTDIEAPRCIMDITSAEMVKYASNAFLATKISFVNEIANLCDLVGADILPVAEAVGMDKRIGEHFLKAGLGYGGSCFPKDTRGLDYISTMNGHNFNLLRAVIEVNTRQRILAVRKLSSALGGLHNRRVGILGLAFKPNTDDMREAPALDIISILLEEGTEVVAFDPIVSRIPEKSLPRFVNVTNDPFDAIDSSNAVVICTECPEIINIDWINASKQMRDPKVILDGRNCLSKLLLIELGFNYIGFGR